MPPTVSATRLPSNVLLLTFANPPVNALSTALQTAIAAALADAHADPSVAAIVLASPASSPVFSAGADIAEFAAFSAMSEASRAAFAGNPLYTEAAERGPKPVVAAVQGICFGGALELALCCSHVVAGPKAMFALPEVRLGIIPGLGGTQRLPRAVGVEDALRMILTGAPISAAEAHAKGLVHEVVAAQGGAHQALVAAAARLAADVASGAVPRRYLSSDAAKIPPPPVVAEICHHAMQTIVPKLSKGGALHQYAEAVRVIQVGATQGVLPAGLDAERTAFFQLVTGDASKALIHSFFAQRAAGRDPALDAAVHGGKPRPLRRVGIIGGGLMGAGIAAAVLAAPGTAVVVREINDAASDAARERVRRNLGKAAAAVDDPARARFVTELSGFADCDIVIEAAVENVKVKQDLFAELEAIVSDSCILATNTSSINIDLVAVKCPRARSQGRVVGAHFFSPAHKMPLLEIIRTESTAPEVLHALLGLAKNIKKTPVVVGNCAGFAVNRMYFPQGQAAHFLVERMAVDPYRIDQASEKFGLPMGPFRLLDLVGIDVGVAISGIYDMFFAERVYNSAIGVAMVSAGFKGQKTGKGFYNYDKASRKGVPDRPRILEILGSQLHAQPISHAELSDPDLVDLTLLPCVNEAIRILEEKMVNSQSDLDIASIMGMGFPSHRGGLIYWAQTTHGGSAGVFDKLNSFYARTNHPLFKPCFALARAANLQAPIGRPPRPTRLPGRSDDVVIVSAYRTAVGRAGRGGFKDTPVDDLLAPVVERILAETKVSPADIGDFVVGEVLPRGDFAVVQVRVAGVLSGLPDTMPVRIVNRLCSSGLQAIVDAANSIRCGDYTIALAGGVESMSQNAFKPPDSKPNPRAQSMQQALDCYLGMGQTSENVAERYGISRERQDRLAVLSHARGSNALLAGRQRNEIVPVTTQVKLKDKEGNVTVKTVTVAADEGIRMGVTAAALGKLKPVFRKDGTTTAGNSSQLSDGAAVTMLMKRSEAARRGLAPLGTLKEYAVVGVDPSVMGIGPAVAIPALLEKAGLNKEDIDLYEINEAFGSQAEYCIDKLGLNRDIVNVNGGAISIGHPLGMTGARLSVSILHELERRGGRYGVVSMCVGTGMGAAALYELCSTDAQRATSSKL